MMASKGQAQAYGVLWLFTEKSYGITQITKIEASTMDFSSEALDSPVRRLPNCFVFVWSTNQFMGITSKSYF